MVANLLRLFKKTGKMRQFRFCRSVTITRLIIAVCASTCFVFSASAASISNADSFKRALEQFKPTEALNGFTSSPHEVNLHPQENADNLKSQGLSNVQRHDALKEVYSNAKTRTRATPNLDSPEMKYAENLIEGSEAVKTGGCHKAPPECHKEFSTHTCEDALNYVTEVCEERLTSKVTTQIHHITRHVIGFNYQTPFDLANCGQMSDLGCKPTDEVHLSPNCRAVSVKATWNGKAVEISQNQTCSNLMVSINTRLRAWVAELAIEITETEVEDITDASSCHALRDKANAGNCVFEKGEPCLDANATKVINGVSIQHACWGKSMQYRCLAGINSTCAPLTNQGCTQTLSICVEQNFGLCMRFSETFECAEERCIPQPDICMPELPCTDGSCDTTKSEESHDMGEGVSRLGALIGAASDVATNQIASGSPKIFAGSSVDCKKYVLGFRDCCTDSGWGDWVKNCPAELQALQKAKADNRVVYLGKYKKHKLDLDHHYAYCVFPSKLGAIIQIEGRKKQLGISFGKAKKPDCKGITPEQLERINFQKLNLSPIEQDFISRFQKPDLGSALQTQDAHIEQLHQMGRPHD